MLATGPLTLRLFHVKHQVQCLHKTPAPVRIGE